MGVQLAVEPVSSLAWNTQSLINLDFSLAAQADTLEEAQVLLRSQIKDCVVDALHGQDRAHASGLLSRRAPLKYWVKWWLGVFRARVSGNSGDGQKAFCEPMPLVPA
jgi:hypothetical protein